MSLMGFLRMGRVVPRGGGVRAPRYHEPVLGLDGPLCPAGPTMRSRRWWGGGLGFYRVRGADGAADGGDDVAVAFAVGGALGADLDEGGTGAVGRIAIGRRKLRNGRGLPVVQTEAPGEGLEAEAVGGGEEGLEGLALRCHRQEGEDAATVVVDHHYGDGHRGAGHQGQGVEVVEQGQVAAHQGEAAPQPGGKAAGAGHGAVDAAGPAVAPDGYCGAGGIGEAVHVPYRHAGAEEEGAVTGHESRYQAAYCGLVQLRLVCHQAIQGPLDAVLGLAEG